MNELTAENWKAALEALARPEKKEILQRFFKTGPGEYAEGDIMLGVTVPDNRSVARVYAEAADDVVETMLQSEIHEHRLSGLLALVRAYEHSKCMARRSHIIDVYLANADRCNNWDLVDLSAPRLLGREISEGRRLGEHRALSASESLWRRRIAIVCTLWPVMKHSRFDKALAECEAHIGDREPLIHKATGWVLREVGNKDMGALLDFLSRNIDRMSATTLSYATEKFDKAERKRWQALRKETQAK